MDCFDLEIVTPTEKKTYSLQWIELTSTLGSLIVGYNHENIISIIKKNSSVVLKKADSSTESYHVLEGCFSFISGKGLIITNNS